MNYSLDSKNDPDRVRNSLSKLKHQHRREKKAVVRELRKEGKTGAMIAAEERRVKEQVYAEKMKTAWGVLKGGNDVGKWERDQKRKRYKS
jgi:Nop14-like family